MSQTIDHLAALRTNIVRIVRESTGLREQLALPVAEAIYRELQMTFGGSSLYIPAPSRADLHQAILDDLRTGRPIPVICRSHGVARATVYRLRQAL